MINSDDSQQEGSRDIRNLIRIFTSFYFTLIVGFVLYLQVKFELITEAWNLFFR
ncbi:MAG: hypothetical protein JJE07_04155 [Flavobacteriaceae bacterium]|nr:hypothetical protein [Flavobacteriaceae bacterium]